MKDLLNLVAHEGAEELILEPGRPPVIVLQGKSRVLDGTLVSSDNAAELLGSIANEEQRRELDRCGDAHFTYVAQDLTRFSVRATVQGENLSLRIINLRRCR